VGALLGVFISLLAGSDLSWRRQTVGLPVPWISMYSTCDLRMGI
jgi:hypothetical protein